VNRIFREALLLFLLLPVSGLQASLIQQDWNVAGDGSIVYDDATGLEWLKLGETVGDTYNYVENQLGASGEYEGFRFAILEEVQTLITNSGATWGRCRPCSAEVGPMEAFIDLMGSGYTFGTGKSSWGYILSDDTSLRNFFHGVLVKVDFAIQAKSAYVTGGFKDSNPYGNLGAFIVREVSPVPLPGSVYLFPLGLLVLAALQTRKLYQSRD
jgi:hypothetical protein